MSFIDPSSPIDMTGRNADDFLPDDFYVGGGYTPGRLNYDTINARLAEPGMLGATTSTGVGQSGQEYSMVGFTSIADMLANADAIASSTQANNSRMAAAVINEIGVRVRAGSLTLADGKVLVDAIQRQFDAFGRTLGSQVTRSPVATALRSGDAAFFGLSGSGDGTPPENWWEGSGLSFDSLAGGLNPAAPQETEGSILLDAFMNTGTLSDAPLRLKQVEDRLANGDYFDAGSRQRLQSYVDSQNARGVYSSYRPQADPSAGSLLPPSTRASFYQTDAQRRAATQARYAAAGYGPNGELPEEMGGGSAYPVGGSLYDLFPDMRRPGSATSGVSQPRASRPSGGGVAGSTGASAGGTTGGTTGGADAYARLVGVLNSAGLGGMEDWVWQQITSGKSETEILQDLRKTPTWQRRFGDYEKALKAGGLPAMNEAEMLSYEQTVRGLFRSYGLPAGFYDQTSDIAFLLGANLTPNELDSRVRQGFARMQSLPAEVRSYFGDIYGPDSEAALAAVFLDPDKAIPVLEQQVNAGIVGGVGRRFGFDITKGRAEDLAAFGVSTVDQAAAGFGRVQQVAPLFGERLTEQRDLTAENEGVDFGFGLGGGGDLALRERMNERVADFSGSSGSGLSRTGSTLGTAEPGGRRS